MTSRLGRRGLLGSAAVGLAVGGTVGGALGAELGSRTDRRTASTSDRLAPADGRVAASPLPQGLVDRIPAFGQVIALDVVGTPAERRTRTVTVLRSLTDLADAAARGEAATLAAEPAGRDLRPASLQVTIGLGRALVADLGRPVPDGLVDMPAFRTDRLRPELSGGDLLVQVGAEDPMRLAGGVQQVVTGCAGSARVRWSRPGFRATAAAGDDPHTTARNLMGHRDGTDNPRRGSPLWHATVTTHDGSWMDGGSYVVARRIAVDLDRWFDHSVGERDQVIGRSTTTGAAQGRRHEEQPVDLDRRTADGALAVPAHAHIRLASSQNTAGARIYRRSWNYDDGWVDGARSAGLMFLAWQADPRRGFIPIQRSLVDADDALHRFTTHIGSALFAVPARGDDAYVGQRALED